LEDAVATLAKLTSKNQLTLPVEVVKRFPGVEHFAVSEVDGELRLVPMKSVKLRSLADSIRGLREHTAKMGITEKDIERAVKDVRRNRTDVELKK
jgi:hypothetical protein